MKRLKNSICLQYLFLFLFFQADCFAQDSLNFKGQLSSWMLYNRGNDLPVYTGARYIPQLNYELKFQKEQKLDFEFSLNTYGTIGFNPFDSVLAEGKLKPYRIWARYSSKQFEVRLGLQKINFGSASILRPLMWFDQVDPRDPLKLTDGVWGALGRYYFLNNANIWLWGLYGNKDPRGWDPSGTNIHFPEMGGRIQLPLPATGEVAVTYHHRVADTRVLGDPLFHYSEVRENRIGFDIKLDLVAGFWLEGSWITKDKDLGFYTNQEILNAGIDYTFGLGNGLYVVYEQLLAASDDEAFKFQNTTSFSLFSLSYPVSIFDNLGGIVYYDWKTDDVYSFINWQKQFNNITLYLIGFWNPDKYNIPSQVSGQALFAGRGIQIMLVLNH